MGFFDLFKRKKVVGKQAVPATEAAQPAKQAPSTPAKASTTKPATTRSTATKPAATTPSATNAQCAAITNAGTQCKSASRDGSKYCGRHKGYRASNGAAKAAAKPAAKTPAKSAKPARANGAGGRQHVAHGDYKLYQNGNRFFFSKKTQAEAKTNGAEPVYAMPKGRTVVVTPNGLPVLKKQ